FFFQAEDGIRDDLVTGVQTCALPISACREHAAEARELGRELGVGLAEVWAIAALGELELGLGRPAVACEYLEELRARLRELAIRSEERRVGKECSCVGMGCGLKIREI